MDNATLGDPKGLTVTHHSTGLVTISGVTHHHEAEVKETDTRKLNGYVGVFPDEFSCLTTFTFLIFVPASCELLKQSRNKILEK